ncbi:MAG: sodium:glutamate symporter [Bacillus sp. (in: firmicutes)]
MEFTIYNLLVDLMLASGLVLIAKLIRVKVKLFQEMFIPTSLIAGLLGLGLGKYGLGILKFSDQFSMYSSVLVILVFASIGLRGFGLSGNSLKENIQNLGSYMCLREIVYGWQYLIPIAFSLFIIIPFIDNVNPSFGIIFGAGWLGGHGTAAALGATLENLGWADATDLAMTSATVGTLTGIFGGIILIKWATRKGQTSYIKDFKSLAPELKTGLIPLEKRESLGKETLSPISLDPLALHVALLIIPSGLAYLFVQYLSKSFNINLPAFSFGFLFAIILFYILKATKADKYIDKKIITRLGGTITDYLVFFGIASINVPIIVKYAVPFAALMIIGIAGMFFLFLFFGPRLIKKDWFEKSIFVYGYATGSFAISLSLLRICDPNNKSSTLDDTAILTPIVAPVDIILLSLAPSLLFTGNWIAVVLPLAIYLVFFLGVPTFAKWWIPQSKNKKQKLSKAA